MPTNNMPARSDRVALCLSVQLGAGLKGLPAQRSQLRRWVQAALEQPAQIVLRFAGRPEAQALNRSYRGRDYATNVLTFVYDAPDEGLPARSGLPHHARSDAPIRADIVICPAVVTREAREQGKRVRDHLAHLVIHGVLHAQGWDHLNARQAKVMQARECELLARFRIADPYQIGPGPG